jgi:hypothetical protein
LFVQANLSEVFNDDVVALNEQICGLVMVRSAILSIAEALFLLELLGTGRAAPGHKSRCKVNIIGQLVLVLIKLLNEVKSEHVVA